MHKQLLVAARSLEHNLLSEQCSLCSINQTQSICWMLIRSKRHGKVTHAERNIYGRWTRAKHGAFTHAKITTHKKLPGADQEQDVLTPTKRENL